MLQKSQRLYTSLSRSLPRVAAQAAAAGSEAPYPHSLASTPSAYEPGRASSTPPFTSASSASASSSRPSRPHGSPLRSASTSRSASPSHGPHSSPTAPSPLPLSSLSSTHATLSHMQHTAAESESHHFEQLQRGAGNTQQSSRMQWKERKGSKREGGVTLMESRVYVCVCVHV